MLLAPIAPACTVVSFCLCLSPHRDSFYPNSFHTHLSRPRIAIILSRKAGTGHAVAAAFSCTDVLGPRPPECGKTRASSCARRRNTMYQLGPRIRLLRRPFDHPPFDMPGLWDCPRKSADGACATRSFAFASNKDGLRSLHRPYPWLCRACQATRWWSPVERTLNADAREFRDPRSGRPDSGGLTRGSLPKPF